MKKTLPLLIILSSLLFADGIIIPPHPPVGPSPRPIYLNVKYHHVFIKIRDNVAQVSVDQVFTNPYTYELEGEYLFPVPRDASISEFSIFVGDKEIKGEVLGKEEARRVYNELVRKRRDPALLEYYDQDLIRAKIFPIQPQGDVRVRLQYECVLEREGGLYAFTYPLKPEALTRDPMKELSLEVLIEARNPIKTVYSPTHDLEIDVSGNTAHLSYEAQNIRPREDFRLFYSESGEELGMDLLTYRKGKEGYFLLTITPGAKPEEIEPFPKDIVFLLDVSGSMLGKKIEQARKALRYFVRSLSPADRFDILAFSSDVRKFSPELVQADSVHRARALSFIDSLKARGGTNIDDALREALALREEGNRPFYVVFLTDGRPTVGTTMPGRIVEDVKENLGNARLFVFGTGYDVNTLLLDALAAMSRSEPEYVEPDEDLEVVLTNFYDKIQFPALTDLELDFDGLDVEKVYPVNLPDLFYGSQVLVSGIYRKPGKFTLVLRGEERGRERVIEREFEFPDEAQDLDFLPRVWARRWVGYLLSEIRLKGETRELVDEVTELGKKYGIITPYTSFLVKEAPDEVSEYLEGNVLGAETGKRAFKLARTLSEIRASASVSGELEEKLDLKRVLDKVFVFKDGFYVDTDYKEGMKFEEIETGSQDYFRFIEEHPEWAPYLSVGDKVIVVLDGKAYRFTSK
ncbi:MAG: VWA domain-containing protein [Candidatus Hydrothermae bacterium]|nr:VWA domain-containing protein [Candidatus Hydrothermae bacterium]